MKRRPNIVIYMEVLSVLLEGPKGPTRLSQICGLNYDKLVEFAGVLESRRFISKGLVDGREVFSLTEEGRQLYADWTKVWQRFTP